MELTKILSSGIDANSVTPAILTKIQSSFDADSSTLTVPNFSVTTVTAGNVKTNNLLYANGSAYVFSGSNAAGSNTQIQFNNANSFAASGNLTFDTATNTLATTNLNATGNVTAGNINAGNISTSGSGGNITGANVVSANTFIGSGNNLSNIQGANVTGAVSSATSATTAGTVTTAAQPNITSVGTLTGFTSNGVVNFTNASNVTLGAVGNVRVTGGSTGQYLQTDGSGTLTWATINTGIPSNIANGNSNVNIPSANGNVNISAVGNANVVVVTGTGANINGYATISGTVTAGNISTSGSGGNITGANVISANMFTGSGNNLSNIQGANVTGAVGLATYATIANAVAGANVSGAVSFATTANSVAGANVSGQVSNALIAGTVYTNAQPNITSVGTLTSLAVTGNLTAGNANLGNLTVSNFFSGSGSALSALTFGNITTFTTAGLTTDELYLQSTTRLNVTASGVSGYLFDQYGAIVNPAIYVTSGQTVSFNLDVTSHPFLIQTSGSANYSIGLVHVDTTGTVLTASSAQGKIAGTLYWKVPYGITGNYKYQCSAHGGMNGNIVVTDANVANIQVGNALIAGTVYTNAQPNITSVGTLTSLAVTGNITSGNANLGNAVVSNFFVGSGAFLTSVTAVTAGTVTTNAQPNITSVGTLTSLIVGNATANSTFGNGNITASGNISFTGANVSLGDASNLKITGGSSGYFLSTDGAGNLSWGAASGGGGVSATGSNTQLQFNDGGALGASANLTFDKATNTFATARIVASNGANLGSNVANVYIGGGSNNQILKTDGSGNLLWIAQPATTITVDNFTGDGTAVAFTLTASPTSINQTAVNYNGTLQLRAAYTVSGSTLTFSEAPVNGSLIEVTTTLGVMSGAGAFVTRSYTGNGVQSTFSVTSGCTVSSVIVTENGLVQVPTVDYTISGGTLTFTTTPANGIIINIRELAIATATTSPGITWNISSSNITMTASNGYFVDTSGGAKTMTLPSSAILGDTIRINDLAGSFATNNLTVARNGHKIQGIADDLLIDADQTSFGLVYSNSTYGWKVLEL